MCARIAPGRSTRPARPTRAMIEAIEKLKKLDAAKFSEVCEKHTFECYRVRSDGCMQEVTVVILDAGPDAQGRARYYCHAKSADGKEVSSSIEPTLDAAFASVNWSELDRATSAARASPAAESAPHNCANAAVYSSASSWETPSPFTNSDTTVFNAWSTISLSRLCSSR